MKKSGVAALLFLAGLSQAEAQNCRPMGPKVPLHAILKTHSIPPLTQNFGRVAKQLTLQLLLMIGNDGKVLSAKIVNSSDYPSVDAITVTHVKSNWKWKPWTGGCISTLVNVTFNV